MTEPLSDETVQRIDDLFAAGVRRRYRDRFGEINTPTPKPPADVAFNAWLAEVDSIVWETANVSVHDLPDVELRAWFDDEMSTHDAAASALETGGWSS